MLYILLGTLYNRYVLELRGFDQLPQFSAESARYHAVSAMDWIRSGYEGWQGQGSVSLRDHHHDHLNGPAARTPAPPSQGQGHTGNEFARPTVSARASVGAGKQRKQPEPNPISHFSQAQQSDSQSPSLQPSPGRDTPPPSQTKGPANETSQVPEEKAFLLGDDDEEGVNEDITVAAATAAQPKQAKAAVPRPIPIQQSAPPAQEQSATEIRGRVSGDGADGKIRL